MSPGKVRKLTGEVSLHRSKSRNNSEAASRGADVARVRKKTVDEVWREIVEGKREKSRRKVDEMMTLEDFLVKVGAVDEELVESDEAQVKVEAVHETLEDFLMKVGAVDKDLVTSYGQQMKVEAEVAPLQSCRKSGLYIGTAQSVDSVGGLWAREESGKRKTTSLLEPLDRVTQQKQLRMIKNRESAARTRERKQAYQVELEALVVKLEEENELLLKDKADRFKDRYKQLMEKVIPVVEKRRPARVLGRVRST